MLVIIIIIITLNYVIMFKIILKHKTAQIIVKATSETKLPIFNMSEQATGNLILTGTWSVLFM